MPKPYYTLDYQFRLAEQALKEARNQFRAKYWTSCISSCYQVAHRGAAGLLFGIQARVETERDVGLGFEAAFVSTGKSAVAFAQDYRRLAKMRHNADFEFEYVAEEREAEEALLIAQRFWDEAQRLQRLVEDAA